MPTPEPRSPDPGVLAETIAERVRQHPSVVGLHGGPFGTVASHLPGRRVLGVRIDETDGSVELAVVVRLGHPLPQVVADLRQRVTTVTGPVAVDVIVADVSAGGDDQTHAG